MKRAIVLLSLLFGVYSSLYAQLNSVVVTGKYGTEVSISELKNGKNPYIIFFHGKGGPSIKLLYAFMDVYEQWNKETGLKLFVISIDNVDTPDIHSYNKNSKCQIDFYFDEEREIGRKGLLSAYPYFVLYDGYGNAVYSKCGFNPTEGFEPQLLSILNSFKSYYSDSNGISDNSGSSDSSREVIRVEDYGLTAAYSGFTAVDLGLSVKWANANLGANSPEEYGNYYAWGETESKEEYTSRNYKFGFITYSKYYEDVDKKKQLESIDDAAYNALRGQWRIPTKEEWLELKKNTTATWATYKGIYGMLLTSKINGACIFLPAAGYKSRYANMEELEGNYWSSTLYIENPNSAYLMELLPEYVHITYRGRSLGYSIRPVSD